MTQPNSVKKYLSILIGGSFIAQILPLLLTPVATRLYTPGEFGELSIFANAVIIIGSLSAFRYDQAIMNVRQKQSVSNMIILAALISLATIAALDLFAALFVALAHPAIHFDRWIWYGLLPLSALMFSLSTILFTAANRFKAFSLMSYSNIARSGLNSAGQIAFGALHMGSRGLILANVLTQFAGVAPFGPLKTQLATSERPSPQALRALLVEFRDFPRFGMFGSVALIMSSNALTILIGSFYGSSVLGHWALADRLLSIPAQIVGNSVSQIFYSEANEVKHNLPKMKALTNSMLLKLLKLGAPFFLLGGLLAKPAFTIAFGEQWTTAALYFTLLIPVAFVRYLVGPLAIIPSIYNDQRAFAVWQIQYFILSLCLFYFGFRLKVPLNAVFMTYSLMGAIMYAYLLAVCHRIIFRHAAPEQSSTGTDQ